MSAGTLPGASSTSLGIRRGYLVVRLFGLSVRMHVRSMWITIALVGLGFAVFAWSVSVGDFPVPISDVLTSVFGGGTPDGDFIVRELRMPRSLTAVLVGAAFGLSGAIFQRIARNPLATPDIIGINSGAAAAAVYAIIVLEAGPTAASSWALGGALVVAAGIYLMAYKKGISGYRLVLIGIGAAALGNAVVWYLLTRAEIYNARDAVRWLTGTLNESNWDQASQLWGVLIVLVPVTLIMARHLRQLEMGDDTARGLGSRVELARCGLLLCAVGLAAVAVATAGPIAFVALVAPQIARRLLREQGLALVASGACGALLLVLSDVAARRVFAPTHLPVGILTAVLGAPYLLYLLARANRVGSGG